MTNAQTAQILAFATVLSIRRCSPISFVAETVPELKSGNHFGGTQRTHRLRKLSRVSGMIGFRYENAVNNQRGREQDAAPSSGMPKQSYRCALPPFYLLQPSFGKSKFRNGCDRCSAPLASTRSS